MFLKKYKIWGSLVAMGFVALFFAVALVPEQAHAWQITPIQKLLSEGDASSNNAKHIWGILLNTVNIFVAVFLIVVAFANILRININTYAIKKVLPMLVLAIVAANFSYLFCRLIVDVANVTVSMLIEGSGKIGAGGVDAKGAGEAVKGNLETVKSITVSSVDDTFPVLLAAIAEFVMAIILFILSFLFFIRNYLIYFLVALSPLAMIAMVLPQTKQGFTMWWSNFIKWVFMPVVSCFWIWMAGTWINSFAETSDSLFGNFPIMSFAFAGVCFYLAITTPFKMGGAVMKGWGDLGKKTWGKTGGAAWDSTGGAAWGAGKKWVGEKYDNSKRTVKNWAKDKVPIVSGISKRIETGKMNQEIIESNFAKTDAKRKELALRDIIRSGKWEGNTPMMKRIKAMEGQLYLGDEWGADSTGMMKNGLLYNQLRFVNDNGNLRIATDVDHFSGQSLYDWQGNELEATSDPQKQIDTFKEAAAAVKELNLRQKNRTRDIDDGTGNGVKPSDIVKGGFTTQNGLTINEISVDLRNLQTRSSSVVGEEIEEALEASGQQVGEEVAEHAAEVLTRNAFGNVTPEAVQVVIAGLSPQAVAAIAGSANAANAETRAEINERVGIRQNDARREASFAAALLGQSSTEGKRLDSIVAGRKEALNQGIRSLESGNSDGLQKAVDIAKQIHPQSEVLLKTNFDSPDGQSAIRGELKQIFGSAQNVLSQNPERIIQISNEASASGAKFEDHYVQQSLGPNPTQDAHAEVLMERMADKLGEQMNLGDLHKEIQNMSDSLMVSNDEIKSHIESLPDSGAKDEAYKEMNKQVMDSMKSMIYDAAKKTSAGGAAYDVMSAEAVARGFKEAMKNPETMKQFSKQMSEATAMAFQKVKGSSGQNRQQTNQNQSNDG